MDQWFNPETMKGLFVTGWATGVLIALGKLVQSIIERRVPSVEKEAEGEQKFQERLLARVTALEKDRDNLSEANNALWREFTAKLSEVNAVHATESAKQEARYNELLGRYKALEERCNAVIAQYEELQRKHEKMDSEYHKARRNLDTWRRTGKSPSMGDSE